MKVGAKILKGTEFDKLKKEKLDQLAKDIESDHNSSVGD